MLDEYVLVPDIFDPGAYSNAALIDAYLQFLREPIMQEALVRDLVDGGWCKYCIENSGSLHRLSKEFVKKLLQGNRLRKFPRQASQELVCSADWCNEGLATNVVETVTGIIAAHGTKQAFNQNEVASIERLTATPWWQGRSPSLSLDRKTTDYLRILSRVLAQANSFMFIDPYLDPSSPGYGQLHQLLAPLASRNPKPRIELHRSFNKGLPQQVTPDEPYWKAAFAGLGAQLRAYGLIAEVFIWSEFHDRFIISDVIGITASAGFDVTNRPNDLAVWSRMGRSTKDGIQKQFDPAASQPKWRFVIGQ
ncbi:hypothetical protein FKV24_002135 [Lysobacter maris]|uniref:Uncharacterized protein n=1 Tax=Marilutibacter maris TaxID=1605891 RepID=A0A508BC50_9GAMM|nr:hypothetical protein [Lysobacter maris]KAB8198437.1 hypothetical protein FKV24_002135 [Lysobacter maris]